jgi:hypothetical protein
MAFNLHQSLLSGIDYYLLDERVVSFEMYRAARYPEGILLPSRLNIMAD